MHKKYEILFNGEAENRNPEGALPAKMGYYTTRVVVAPDLETAIIIGKEETEKELDDRGLVTMAGSHAEVSRVRVFNRLAFWLRKRSGFTFYRLDQPNRRNDD